MIESLQTLKPTETTNVACKRLRTCDSPAFWHGVRPILLDAARPDHEVLVTYVGHIGIYHTCDDANRTVCIEYVEDTRRDPLGRFGD